jgi:hypothetical protein
MKEEAYRMLRRHAVRHPQLNQRQAGLLRAQRNGRIQQLNGLLELYLGGGGLIRVQKHVAAEQNSVTMRGDTTAKIAM